jgi:carboxypeptidase family protein
MRRARGGLSLQMVFGLGVAILLLALRLPESERAAVVRGLVLSGIDSSPRGNALVLLEGGSFRQIQSTDTAGRFLFSSVPVGGYLLTVRALSYHPFRDSIRVGGDTLTFTVVVPAHCEFDSVVAVRDIARRHVRVLLHGGIAPLAYGAIDRRVERMYGFRYIEFGDMVSQPFECDQQYHRVVFRYFDQKFGSRWRDSVRVP